MLAIDADSEAALGDGGTLFEAPKAWAELGRMPVRVAPRGPGDKGRMATVALKAGTVTIRRPASGHKQDPASLRLGLIEASEVDAAPGVDKPLVWRLLTTLPAQSQCIGPKSVRTFRMNPMHKQKPRAQLRVQRSVRRSG